MPSSNAAFVVFDGNKLIPAPFFRVEKSFQKTEDGRIIGSLFNITLSQSLVPGRGSPNSTGVFYQGSSYPDDEIGADPFSSLLAKKEAMRKLFNAANDGKTLEVLLDCNALSSLTCNPRILGITFDEGNWTQTLPYTISLECDSMVGLYNNSGEDVTFFDQYISDATESWSLEFDENAQNDTLVGQHMYRLRHEVSAKGKRHYDGFGNLQSQAWEQARSYVQSRLGFDANKAVGAGITNLPALNYYNHYRTQNLDEDGGTFAVTEDFLVSSGNAREEFTVTSTISNTEPINSVQVEGAIYGFEVIDYGAEGTGNFQVTTTKYQAASGLWNTVSGQLYTRAQIYAEPLGRPLNIFPLSQTVGKNPQGGVINYSTTYDTRPSNAISGALSESIVVSYQNPTDVFARLTVLGRQNGPILQDINTITETIFNLSINLIMPVVAVDPRTEAGAVLFLNSAPTGQVQQVVDSFYTVISNGNQIFKSNDNPSWEPKVGSYSRQISWSYVPCPG